MEAITTSPAPKPAWIARNHPRLASLLELRDRRLRARQGIREYSSSPECLFRMEIQASDVDLLLSDGTRIRAGDRVVRLHLWNEHVPRLPAQGPSIAWARSMVRAFDSSLHELASYLASRKDLDDVAAICGTMSFGTASRTEQIIRIAAQYGFERVPGCSKRSIYGSIRRFGENILVSMIVLTCNPAALRADTLSRGRAVVCLSRRVLHQRYGVMAGSPAARPARSRLGRERASPRPWWDSVSTAGRN